MRVKLQKIRFFYILLYNNDAIYKNIQTINELFEYQTFLIQQ